MISAAFLAAVLEEDCMCIIPVGYTTVEQLAVSFVSVSLHTFHSWMDIFVGFFFLLMLAKIKPN